MIPYADSLYFSILIYPSVIAIALGLFGRLSWRWVAGINLAMVAVQYSDRAEMTAHDTAQKIWLVAAYGLFQLAIARAFLSLRGRRDSRAVFRTAIVAALLPLAIVKFVPADKGGSYINFLGISYATFRSLDVIICIQDRLIEALSPGRYLTYLIFFPSISAGPIDRYRRFLANCERLPARAEYLKNLDGAVQHVFRGLLYKFILATLLKNYWLDPALAGHGVLSVISYMYAYAFYLFFDFAGYSAFAIGFSYMLGIQTPENFSQPFLATNIVDFWNRWHISLSMWFRDHVYMRFVMASIRNRWFANKLLMSCVGFYISFGLMGAWHGLAPRYLVYGFYHATLVSGYTILAERRKRRRTPAADLLSKPVATLITFHLVCFGLLIFSGRLG